MAATLEERIKSYNAGRYAPLLKMKYEALAESPFRFFRGTDHLFYEDLYHAEPWKDRTRVWVCGDLHLENFGSYRAANNQVYFDINDFDEAALAPATWELVRFLVSIHAASDYWSITPKQASALCNTFLTHYVRCILHGKAYAIEKETTSPMIRTFFDQVEKRTDKQLLLKRISLDPPGIRKDNDKALDADKKERKHIEALFSGYLGKKIPGAAIHDLAVRISGTGSLGLRRFIILAQQGKGRELFLFDLKYAQPSSLAKYSPNKQPSWKYEAERIVTIQKLMPYAVPKYLDAIRDGKVSFVFRQLQPSADKFDQRLCKGKLSLMEILMREMAAAVASAQIRSSSRYGSGTVDDLIGLAEKAGWRKKLIDYAERYHRQLLKDFELYCRLYKKGAFVVK
jgi:uncharacterized protein (DUF2252 family)